MVPCITSKLVHEMTSRKCHTCDLNVDVDYECHWCAECDELMCEHCYQNVTRNPEYRVRAMKKRCASVPNHWVHTVQGETVPTAKYLMSWNNNCNRRYVNFDELVENGTKEGTYAYNDAQNLYSARDKRKIWQNDSRYGQRGDGARDRDGDKRQRRGYW